MLFINIDNFKLDKKTEIVDENGNLQFWSQPDFSYKCRVHVYDKNDNEIGYVQFKILTIQDKINYFNKEDKPIEMEDLKVIEQKSNFDYKVSSGLNEVMSVTKEDNRVTINVQEEHINRCILLMYSLADNGEK